ncbi:MAG TPA: hypothetical protein VGA00_08150 [Acidiferrobacterales bacterium]|jgi:hypothetical protein
MPHCKAISRITAALLGAAALGGAYAGPIDTLQPGHWYMAPDSRLDSVEAKPPTITQAHYDSIRGVIGISGVIRAWSGGAYDSKRDRLIVWGGGHADYGGNEVYAFDVNALAWQRLTLPSQGPFDRVQLNDGRPASMHTYDGLAYIPPPIDRFYAHASAYYTTGNGSRATWFFDFDAREWQRKADIPESAVQQITAYDPVSGLLFEHGINAMYAFNPATNQWTTAGDVSSGSWYQGDMTMTVDPKRRKIVAIGRGSAFVWTINANGTVSARSPLSTSGATDIQSPNAPGFVYDSSSDRFVAWNGGASVYVLNMDTLVWSRVNPAATNSVVPTNVTASGGTFGRFQYIPSKNAFIAVNATNQNVYIYKLSSGTGGSVPQTPAQPNVQLR